MNRRFTSVLLFALVVSGIASLLVYHFVLSGLVESSRQKAPEHRLLVASHDLAIGTLIQDSDLRWSPTRDEVPAFVVSDPKQAIGRGVISTVFAGEPVVDGRLAPKGAGAGLAAMIPVGMRAVAMKVDQVIGLAGFVVPGMRVDVIVAGMKGTDMNPSNLVWKTILQNIEVLSAGQKIEKSREGKPEDAQVVNLLVTPEQAESLSLASNESKTQLVLRNPLDQKEATTRGASVASIFGMTAPVPTVVRTRTVQPVKAPAPPAEMATVEVFNGSKKSEQSLAQ